MNNFNFNNCLEIDKINSQIERADIQKNRLIRKIYSEYESYLNLVRSLLYIFVDKGINELYNYPSIKDNFLNENELFSLIEKNITKIIYNKLPFLTVEQLRIYKFEKNIFSENNSNIFELSSKRSYDQKEKFYYEDVLQLDEPIKFQISEDISNTSAYYKAESHEKFVSLNLDKNDQINYLSNNHIIESIGIEKQFISSLLELMEEVKVEKLINSEKENINPMDISSKLKDFKNFDLIDKSLENLLINLSYEINQELFKANLIKKIISRDSFEYLVSKKLILKHPKPFVIEFELNVNLSSSKVEKFPSIIFFNISTVELEFKNINLSIQRNKINELKNQFQRLVKKEGYWRQKEKTLNKIR